MTSTALSAQCAHTTLLVDPSPNAAEVGYRKYTPQQLANASVNGKGEPVSLIAFPRPLVLPGDDLSEDPRCPPQSLRSWLREPDRNEVTSRRNKIYVASPPVIGRNIRIIDQWATPQSSNGLGGAELRKALKAQGSATPAMEGVEEYLRAFYTGMSVTRLSPGFEFTNWDDVKSSKARNQSIPCYVGLQRLDEVVGIRARPCPDGMFKAQLNLNDILDATISALPDDAYALLLMVHQDLYEDDEDDFCCGRAYGGSRVAVVSTSRYNPCFDEIQGVERDHAWPASHCAAYVNAVCEGASEQRRPTKKSKKSAGSAVKAQDLLATQESGYNNPIQAAIQAHTILIQDLSTSEALLALWTARVCRTASHELGHCFGIAHCVYYACVMQSTASLAEDARQPPYLCPIDLAKLLRATGASEAEHYAALQRYCETHRGSHMIEALNAWLRELQSVVNCAVEEQ